VLADSPFDENRVLPFMSGSSNTSTYSSRGPRLGFVMYLLGSRVKGMSAMRSSLDLTMVETEGLVLCP
jgi:hypothetical protein